MEENETQEPVTQSNSNERTKILKTIAEVAMTGVLPIAQLCNKPHFRTYKFAPSEVEEGVKRLGGTIPNESPYIFSMVKKELGQFVSMVLMCMLLFPHLTGLSFEGTLGNALVVSTAVVIVRSVVFGLLMAAFLPVVLFALSESGHKKAAKMTEERMPAIATWFDIGLGFFYPFFTIMLLAKVVPTILTVTSWEGPVLAACSMWILSKVAIMIWTRAFILNYGNKNESKK